MIHTYEQKQQSILTRDSKRGGGKRLALIVVVVSKLHLDKLYMHFTREKKRNVGIHRDYILHFNKSRQLSNNAHKKNILKLLWYSVCLAHSTHTYKHTVFKVSQANNAPGENKNNFKYSSKLFLEQQHYHTTLYLLPYPGCHTFAYMCLCALCMLLLLFFHRDIVCRCYFVAPHTMRSHTADAKFSP